MVTTTGELPSYRCQPEERAFPDRIVPICSPLHSLYGAIVSIYREPFTIFHSRLHWNHCTIGYSKCLANGMRAPRKLSFILVRYYRSNLFWNQLRNENLQLDNSVMWYCTSMEKGRYKLMLYYI